MNAQSTETTSHLATADYVKALLHNSILLQVRNPVDLGGSSDGLVISSLKKALGEDSPQFTLFPIADGGRHGSQPRFALVWSFTSVSGILAKQSKDTSKALESIIKIASDPLSAFSVQETNKRTRQRIITSAMKIVTQEEATSCKQISYSQLLEIVQAALGKPAQQSSRPQAGPNSRMRKDLAEDTSRSGENDDMGFNKTEKLAWIISMIADHEKQARHDAGVKLAPPPPGHPTTSILRPVVKEEPEPEPEAQVPFSPLDYQTTLGNACVVHDIYLEARRTTRPRTRAEELSRRKRALRMAYKEILAVIGDIEWHRKGTGFKSGPQSSVLVGLEQVPDENHRPWLLEKLDVLKTRQCEVRCAIEENEEARRHLIAVMDAVLITLRAGANGIVF